MFKSHFGSVLRKQRLQRGLTQENLASLSNMERTFISMLERGIKQPSLESICNLSQAFGLKTFELLHMFEQEILRASQRNPDDPDLQTDQRNLADLESRQDTLRIEKIIDKLPVAFFTRTPMPDYRPTFFSANISKLTGFERSQFIGSNTFWVDHIHPDDREPVMRRLRDMKPDTTSHLNYRLATCDGKWLKVHEELRFTPGSNGIPGEVLGTIIKDTTGVRD
jgi:transcriptional regulator with XRE-family HTH domain